MSGVRFNLELSARLRSALQHFKTSSRALTFLVEWIMHPPSRKRGVGRGGHCLTVATTDRQKKTRTQQHEKEDELIVIPANLKRIEPSVYDT